MEQLPPHVAIADEPISAPWGDRFDGPDLRSAAPIAVILDDLRQYERDEGYANCFRKHLHALGIDISGVIERDGSKHLWVGCACDAQIRHRSRYIHFLFKDLGRDGERRAYLIDRLLYEGCCTDKRPTNPRQTTKAIRDFLRVQGRILIDPEGHLSEGGGIPPVYLNGTDTEADESVRASRAYYDVRRRFRADQHIKRAAQMLGRRTSNGWTVLETANRSASPTNTAEARND